MTELVEDAGELVERAIKPRIQLRPPGQGGADERLLAAPAQVLARERSGEPA